MRSVDGGTTPTTGCAAVAGSVQGKEVVFDLKPKINGRTTPLGIGVLPCWHVTVDARRGPVARVHFSHRIFDPSAPGRRLDVNGVTVFKALDAALKQGGATKASFVLGDRRGRALENGMDSTSFPACSTRALLSLPSNTALSALNKTLRTGLGPSPATLAPFASADSGGIFYAPTKELAARLPATHTVTVSFKFCGKEFSSPRMTATMGTSRLAPGRVRP